MATQPRMNADALAVAEAYDVDLVVIASPNVTHFELARTALEAGKAVVVDKPFMLRLREPGELIELADRRKALLTAFHGRRWDGDFLAVRDVV